jgi:hypothetical protein
MVAPVPLPPLDLNLSNQSSAKSGASGSISPVSVGGLNSSPNWTLLLIVGGVIVTGLALIRKK